MRKGLGNETDRVKDMGVLLDDGRCVAGFHDDADPWSVKERLGQEPLLQADDVWFVVHTHTYLDNMPLITAHNRTAAVPARQAPPRKR